ncbi:MAG: hypothetical protein OHK0029_19180 [Armatimonadaceae bacterium]
MGHSVFTVFVSIVCIGCIFNGTTRSSSAHENSSDVISTFEDTLERIANEGRISILVEGTPYLSRLTEQEQSLVAQKRTVEDALVTVATLRDYRVLQDSKGKRPQPSVYILQKQYRKYPEVPCVTFEECKTSLAEIHNLLERFDPHPPVKSQPDLIFDVVDSIPDQQVTKEKAFLVKNLSREAQAQLWRMALYVYIGNSTSDARRQIAGFNEIQEQKIYRTKNDKGETDFGYNVTYRDGQQGFISLTASGFGFLGPNFETPPASVAQPAQKLSEIIAQWNKHTSDRYEVDPALATKPVLLFGEQFTHTDDLLYAVADLYGLRVKSENSQQLLTFKKIDYPRNLGDLYASVRQRIPEPLSRAIRDGEWLKIREQQFREREYVLQRAARGQASPELISGSPSNPVSDRLSDRVGYISLNQMMREVKDAFSRKPQGTTIPFLELPDAVKNAYAAMKMCLFLGWINSIAPVSEPPRFITEFPNLLVQVRELEINGKKTVGVSLYTNNNGQLGEPLTGISVPDTRSEQKH